MENIKFLDYLHEIVKEEEYKQIVLVNQDSITYDVYKKSINNNTQTLIMIKDTTYIRE